MPSATLHPLQDAGPPHDGGAGVGFAGREHEHMERVAFALHEMCQPLMALQCRLEIGRMIDTAAGYEEAVLEGLAEYERVVASMDVLRDEVLRGLQP